MSPLSVQATVTVIVSVSLAHKDAVFVQKPQNHTLFNMKKHFSLNCSTDIASEYGMDWVVQINGIRERVCSSQNFYINGNNSCLLNYSMEVPNNQTLNLIVDPQIARLGDEYCCQFDNGAGKKSCSYLTIFLTNDPVGDLTDYPRFADTTTVIDYTNITESEQSPDNSLIYRYIGIGVVLFIIVVAVVVICLILRKRRLTKKSENNNGEEKDVKCSLTQSEELKNQRMSAAQNGACL